ncbi:MAG TPA: hypothetical protein VIM36_02070, partial [Gemmatimonadaceae bacterium]
MSEALWTPSPERVIKANMTEFLRYVEERGGPPVPDYSSDSYWQLHEWSVNNPERFWSLTWRFCGIIGHRGTGGGAERERKRSYCFAQLAIADRPLMSLFVPRRESRRVIRESKKILGEVEAGVGKPSRSLLRIGRTHLVESDSHALRTAARASMSDDSAESPRQRPESLRIVHRPFVELPVRIRGIVGNGRTAAFLHVPEELGHVRLDDALGRGCPQRLAHFC